MQWAVRQWVACNGFLTTATVHCSLLHCSLFLVGETEAAVYVEVLAGDVAAGIGTEEEGGAGAVGGSAEVGDGNG